MDIRSNLLSIRPALVRIALYIVIVITPLVLAAIFRPDRIDILPCELGRSFALLGFAILAMQFVLSARLKWIERPFGLDMLFRFHKAMGVFAASLLVIHPILLILGKQRQGWDLLYRGRMDASLMFSILKSENSSSSPVVLV